MTAPAPDDLARWRRDCPITDRGVFLNHAAVAPLPRPAVCAARTFLEQASTTGLAHYSAWEARAEEVRAAFASLIGADPADIAFIKNTSEGLSFVAGGLAWNAGESVVTYGREFPANIYPWFNLKDRGVTTRFLSDRNGRICIDDIAEALDDTTRVLSLSSVQFATGFRLNLDEVGALCRDRGVLFCVDAIQSAGAFPIDVKSAPIDFLAADAHKWLLGPEGIGFFYCAPRNLDTVRLTEVGWKTVANADAYLEYDFMPAPDARRFEPGSLSYLGILAAGGSLDFLCEAGIDRVAASILDVTDYLVEGLSDKGYEVISPRGTQDESSGIVMFRGREDPAHTVERLEKENIFVAARGAGVRASPHFYNSRDDVDRFLSFLGPNS